MEVSFSVIFNGQPVVSQNTYSSKGNTDSDFSLVRFLETLFKPWNHWWGWMLKPHKIGRGLYYFAIFTLHFYRYCLLSSTRVCLGRDWAVNSKDRGFFPGSLLHFYLWQNIWRLILILQNEMLLNCDILFPIVHFEISFSYQ